jgi:3-methyladenine DNA glycosylase AlkD
MDPYSLALIEELKGAADGEKAVPMKAYMKNQFSFLGITTPDRRNILKKHHLQNPVNDIERVHKIVYELWLQPYRELQYCGLEFLGYQKKLWQKETIEVIEHCITNKSWWDTVDPLSYDCAGLYFKKFPVSTRVITGRWNHSDNFWLQRSSLLFQKSYKQATDVYLLSEYILHLRESGQFFIQKAIGWILREYAKTDPAWVKDFVNTHELAPLSKREAMKHL